MLDKKKKFKQKKKLPGSKVNYVKSFSEKLRKKKFCYTVNNEIYYFSFYSTIVHTLVLYLRIIMNCLACRF